MILFSSQLFTQTKSFDAALEVRFEVRELLFLFFRFACPAFASKVYI